MKKIICLLAGFVFLGYLHAQTVAKPTTLNKNQAGDHFVMQVSSDHWTGAPDSINNYIKGFSRGFNMAVMMNKPFKTSPKWSAAFGIGVSTSNIYFKKMELNISAAGTKLPFVRLDSANYFKKYKVSTAYIEVPAELRFTLHPEKEKSSWKFAVGAKVGMLIDVHTKGKTLLNASGSTLNAVKEKTYKSTFFNGSRIAVTARVGIGNFSLFGAYALTGILKDGVGPNIKPLQIGLCISGL